MSNFGGVYLRDVSGNTIEVKQGLDGDKYVGTAMIQDIHTDTNNSSTANLTSGATFTGVTTETFGVNGIQLYHTADQDCIIYLDQSLDSDFTDSTQTVIDETSCLANEPCTRVIMSVAPYFRVRVLNNSSSPTTKHITAVGVTPMINPLPRVLSDDGRLMTEAHIADQNGRHLSSSYQEEMLTTPVYRLVGTSFKLQNDPNFWVEVIGGTGLITYAGEAILSTGTDAAGSAQLNSVRTARYVPGSLNKFEAISKPATLPVVGRTSRLGAYNDDNGVFFEISGTTVSVVTRKSGVDTKASNGSFNGDYGPFLSLGTVYQFIEIEYGGPGVWFYINKKLLHSICLIGQGTELVNTFELPIRAEIFNDGSTANNVIDVIEASIFRIGELQTSSTYKYLAGVTTNTLKYGAGNLHRIVIADSSGNATIYDGIDATGTLIAEIDLQSRTLEFGIDFNIGLYVVTTAGTNITVIYE